MPPLDVLVIGAGPAGSAAALACARQGLSVVLTDRRLFPRDKVCGDALIPDALQAMADLGVRERVLSIAHEIGTIRIYAPNGRYTTLHGTCACVPRAAFDDVLRRAAVDAGAEFVAPVRALAPLEKDGVVVGARFVNDDSSAPLDIRAGTTILATGAASDVLARFGMCLRSTASATAARIYVRVDEEVARQYDFLCIAYAAGVCPGYGWIFPGPDGVFNLGVGYLYGRGSQPRETNIRKLLDGFVASFPLAIDIMSAATNVGPLKGAPLRTAMEGARLSRPGLVVVGEAAGLTYSFSGEGIGKSMQSGIFAAEAVSAGAGSPDSAEAIAETYAARLSLAFRDRFKAYERLQRLVATPFLANALIWRARTGTYVHGQFEGLLNETGRADELLSLSGLWRGLWT